jgi:hypothetical protein
MNSEINRLFADETDAALHLVQTRDQLVPLLGVETTEKERCHEPAS